MLKKVITMEYEVVLPKGKLFASDYNIEAMLHDIYDKAIKEQGCSALKVTISTVEQTGADKSELTEGERK